MSNQQQQSNTQPITRQTFPSPPPFYKLYTIPKKKEKNDEVTLTDEKQTEEKEENIDTEFYNNLYTPPIPLTEPFTKFKEIQTGSYMEHKLGDDVPILYKRDENGKIQYAAELRRLNHSLLTNYLQLLSLILTSTPESVTAQLYTLSHRGILSNVVDFVVSYTNIAPNAPR